nr:immunoglobulin light chain junction region [Macaca mulatta]
DYYCQSYDSKLSEVLF